MAASSTAPAPTRRRAEIPEDDNHHALGALRCLIAKLDARKLGRKAKSPPHAAAAGTDGEAEGEGMVELEE